ncbi:MAG: sterol desaturase family protein [Deltaproteobacteria bacterium]|nr:sterol desaturase family protein [Deltaproteobacteria bacterium]
MIGIPLGLLAANGAEWVIHKHLLHRLGRRKKSIWAFHWTHHRSARKGELIDDAYHRPFFAPEWNTQSLEAVWIGAAAAAFTPLLPVAPFFVGTTWACALRYLRLHRRAHLDPEWAREHLPWHFDHHMGPDQEANWCVTHPFFDHVMGTRKPYAFTEREARDQLRASVRPRTRAPVGSYPLAAE